MKQLGLTQEFLLCILGKNGKIPTLDMQKILCTAASGVLELLLDGVVELDGKKLSVVKDLPVEKGYLRPVFSFIERKQPVKIEKVIEDFSITFTDKNITELTSAIGDSLTEAGCVRKERGGLLGGKTVYIPGAEAVDGVVQNIRAEFLEKGELSEDIIALTALLHKSGDLSRYFSDYEKKDLKKRIKEIRENPDNEEIRRVTDYVDALFMLFLVAIS